MGMKKRARIPVLKLPRSGAFDTPHPFLKLSSASSEPSPSPHPFVLGSLGTDLLAREADGKSLEGLEQGSANYSGDCLTLSPNSVNDYYSPRQLWYNDLFGSSNYSGIEGLSVERNDKTNRGSECSLVARDGSTGGGSEGYIADSENESSLVARDASIDLQDFFATKKRSSNLMFEDGKIRQDNGEFKKQRRMLSNRESTRKSRRQMQEHADLTKNVDALRVEIKAFRCEVDKLDKDCKGLELENASITEELRRNGCIVT